MKLEHIGIAVANLEASNEIFAALFGRSSYKIEGVESEGVMTSFFDAGGAKIELVAATNDESPISKYITNKGEGIHHLAFEVEDLEFEINRLTNLGFRLINTVPKDGADNKRIAFLHPKSTNSVLIELCQEKVS